IRLSVAYLEMKVKRSEMWRAAVLLLLTGCVCASVPEEPADRAAPSDGYCSWITRAQPHGAGGRREGFSEFRLRVEGDPEHYNPGSIYRVSLYATNPAYFRGFTLIALKEGHNGDQEEDYAGNFQSEFGSKLKENDTQWMPGLRWLFIF
uniref:Reelin domain-containing protein n=1 Tax=Sinocyclocheilus rhinocerous TaxID=307959 RepID=A0A673LPL9_9TELE